MASKGDQFAPLFTLAEDFHNNACINWSNDPLELYARAYKKAAEKLIIEVVRARILWSTQSYSYTVIILNFVCKEIIREGWKLLEESGNFPPHHRIHDLWPTAMAIIEKVLFRNRCRNECATECAFRYWSKDTY